jgi:hypothetical protein
MAAVYPRHRDIVHPRLEPLHEGRREERILQRHHDMDGDGHPGWGGRGPPAAEVAAIQGQAADRIVADVAPGHLFVPPGQEQPPGGLWQDRDEERSDIPAAQQLRAQLRPGPRCPDASTDPAGEVAQVRAGNTRVAVDEAVRPGVLDGGPALDRAPVVPHQVDSPDAHPGEHGEGIVHEGL